MPIANIRPGGVLVPSVSSGVLVIATGGNVCLCVAKESGTDVLKQASIDVIRGIVATGEEHDTLTFYESGVVSRDVRVQFVDLRRHESAFVDPELLDSAQVDPNLWTELASVIAREYASYEGFVVLHGLDTMAFTASALSFMLGDLDKPVVVTGAQRPLNFKRTDAVQNITTAITFAAGRSLGLEPPIREVSVYSHDTLYRGNRVSMVSASSYRSFDSANYPALAGVGASIEVQTHLVRRHRSGKRLNLQSDTSARVHILDVYPGMDPGILRGIRKSNERLRAQDPTAGPPASAPGEDEVSPVSGILLRTYGMGTAPTEKGFLKALEEVVESGVLVVNVTQARSGRISHGLDPISLRLFEHGVVSGVDMTSEAAYAKMVVLLSQRLPAEEVADLVQIDHCGEQSQSIFTIHYGDGATREGVEGIRDATATTEPIRIVTRRDLLDRSDTQIRFIQLRILGLHLDPKPSSPRSRVVSFNAYLVDKGHAIPLIVDELKRQQSLSWSRYGRDTINVAFDITESRDQLLSAGTMLRIDTTEPVRWKIMQVVIHAEVGE
jgi:L-asparaginase